MEIKVNGLMLVLVHLLDLTQMKFNLYGHIYNINSLVDIIKPSITLVRLRECKKIHVGSTIIGCVKKRESLWKIFRI